ncbi:hypothetical protein EIN_403070 [Entamoeba invadens IP1]|uniref:Small GTP-binding protein n=1 Tax=Entamoeba invadens IP1 TaxID=370355 RepID=A0A0A1U6E8_ENTIV|nr:hypothetical protein EIN_403070 [Entamoeba invadens IP1]ELP89993.1 hypothetical protein EIN_403070 [Entamoeba invadens IP1]|eukprot:XP_004256764.1 hypothetical protein EIN_403070 [Entamoeba invadens IP1]
MNYSTPPIKYKPSKITVIGDSGVGKSALISQFLNRVIDPNTQPTIGNISANTKLDDGTDTLNVVIWDTAGQERFKSMTDLFFREARGCVIVFDLTDYSTFIGTQNWYERICKNSVSPPVCVLVGNKKDLSHKEVNTDQALKQAALFNALYFEVSALTGEGVKDAFYSFLGRIEPEVDQKVEVVVGQPTNEKKEKKCC